MALTRSKVRAPSANALEEIQGMEVSISPPTAQGRESLGETHKQIQTSLNLNFVYRRFPGLPQGLGSLR